MKRILGLTVTCPALAPTASALPPKPPRAKQTRANLVSLKIHAPLSMTGYSRSKFRHWISQGNGCDTRDRVLIRDGKNVQVGSSCSIISGTWTSFYDGLKFTSPTKLDIDHVVPLANAWISGARKWDPQQREDFANDLTDSQLIAVSAASNRSKGDASPDQWKPPRRRGVVSVLTLVGAGQVPLEAGHHPCGAHRAPSDAGHLLARRPT